MQATVQQQIWPFTGSNPLVVQETVSRHPSESIDAGKAEATCVQGCISPNGGMMSRPSILNSQCPSFYPYHIKTAYFCKMVTDESTVSISWSQVTELVICYGNGAVVRPAGRAGARYLRLPGLCSNPGIDVSQAVPWIYAV